MRRPRLTLRRMMLAVAIAGAGLYLVIIADTHLYGVRHLGAIHIEVEVVSLSDREAIGLGWAVVSSPDVDPADFPSFSYCDADWEIEELPTIYACFDRVISGRIHPRVRYRQDRHGVLRIDFADGSRDSVLIEFPDLRLPRSTLLVVPVP